MKASFIALSILICSIGFSHPSNAMSWVYYANFDPKTTPFTMVYKSMQRSFEERLASWKENKAKDVENYIKMGFTKSLAESAVKQRISWAEKVVQSNFRGANPMPPVVGFVENRAKIMTSSAALGYKRFQKLVKKYHFGVKDDFYQCLCHSYNTVGTGLNYHPGRTKDCPTTDPCKGGNWGCVHKDLPKKTIHWAYCARKYQDDSGKNIFHAINDNIYHKHGEKYLVLNRMVHILSARNRAYKNYCLPALPNNPDENPLLRKGLHKQQISEQALSIVEQAPNLCEESVAANLFLNSKQGQSNIALVARLISEWVIPDSLSTLDMGNNAISSLSEKASSGIVSEAIGKYASPASKIKNIYSNVVLLQSEMKKRKMDRTFAKLYELFRNSSKWPVDQLKSYSDDLTKEMNVIGRQLHDIDNKINDIDSDFQKKSETARRATEKEARTMGQGGKNAWRALANEQRKWKREAEDRIEQYQAKKKELLVQRTLLSMKKNIMQKYRIPFAEEGCGEKYLAKREAACKKRRAEEAHRARQEDIRQSIKRANDIPMGGPPSNRLEGGVVGPAVKPKK